MKYFLVSVFDRRVNAFMQPVVVVSLAHAQRGFLKELDEGEFKVLRGDVSLHCVGEFDEESGALSAGGARELISSAV